MNNFYRRLKLKLIMLQIKRHHQQINLLSLHLGELVRKKSQIEIKINRS